MLVVDHCYDEFILGFEWNGLCFWLNTEIPTVVKHAYPVDIHVGVASNCGEDGHPANIYTEEQYTLMMEYLRTKIEVIEGLIDWTMVYTGMTFDPLVRTLLLTPYLKKGVNWITQR